MNNNIIFLHCTKSYPLQFSATNTKVELMARGLMQMGDNILIVDGIVGDNAIFKTYKGLSSVGLNYILYPFMWHQLVSWLFNLNRLYIDLRNNKSKTLKNIIILESPDYHLFLIYIIYAKLLGYQVASIFHEWGLAVKGVHPLRKPSVWLYSYTFGYFVNGIMPISHFLQKKSAHFKRKSILLPILAEYSRDVHLSLNETDAKESYFLYCANAAYKRTVEFIVETYEEYRKLGGKQNLILVLSGSLHDINRVQKIISTKKISNYINIKSKLPYTELLENYKKATGLIIPLNPNSLQDRSRFSQKIAEYISSNRPIITSNVGEIPYYFKNNESAFIVEDYSPHGYASKMIDIENNCELANKVGYNGRKVGEENFNYNNYGIKLHTYFKLL